ncbi:glycoside hydrolase family 43 protein [Aspergillus lucknowensis]|uniref:Glycosyl hydrolase n=1 Tax=Aspergillus lucknowensis TaxID=176173 RepID=A0ABR4LTG9_9EURO
MAGTCLAARNGTHQYHNPMLPGWHSDPSCTFVHETETFFCVTSTFIAFPGLPLYASKDLQSWELASNVFNRPSQIPDLAKTDNQQGGIYAPTLRYRDGVFYLIVSNLGTETKGLVFTSSDPYDDAAWSEPLVFEVRGIDPDIFFDDDEDGQVYVTSSETTSSEGQQIQQYALDLSTGETGPVSSLWNGTGGVWPEGPHIYKKDGYYYLLIAEGGTEMDHSVMMARSRTRTGPWEPCPGNPVLTNRGTDEYFQTVGHADLFQDARGNWWGVALSTRTGPEFVNYPMGRETVLTSGTWEEGGWPVLNPVRGVMSGPLPPRHEVEDDIAKPEHLTFAPGSEIPKHLMYWRFPEEESYVVSPKGHPHTLRLTPSNYGPSYNASSTTDPITLLARRQTDTLFTYSVDLELASGTPHLEAGISVFITQEQHVDLSIVNIVHGTTISRAIELKTTGRGNYNGTISNVTMDLPYSWGGKKVTLTVQAVDDTTYHFFASPASRPKDAMHIGEADTRVLSGDTGKFTGTLVGVYASRGGRPQPGYGEDDFAYFSNWRYEGQGQKVDYDLIV